MSTVEVTPPHDGGDGMLPDSYDAFIAVFEEDPALVYNDPQRFLTLTNAAIAFGERMNDREWQAKHTLNRGEYHAFYGEWAQMRADVDEGLSLARAVQGIAKARLHMYAELLLTQADMQEELHVDALAHATRAQEYAREAGEHDMEAAMHIDISAALTGIGDVTGVLEHNKLALQKISKQRGDEYALALHNIAATCFTIKDYSSARAYIEEAFTYTIHDPRVRLLLYDMSVRTHSIQRQFPEALAHAQESRKLAERLGPGALAQTMYSISLVWIRQNECTRAIEACEEGLALVTKTHVRGLLLSCLANAYAERARITPRPDGLPPVSQDVELARKYLAECEAILPNMPLVLKADHLSWIGETRYALGDVAGAYQAVLDTQEAQSLYLTSKVRTEVGSLRLLMQVEREEHARAVAQMNADRLQQELANATIHLAAQTELLAGFRNELREIVRQVDEPINALKKIKEKLKTLPCEHVDWARFEQEFTSVHPEFKQRLGERFPELTKQEIKMCQLARLGLKNHQMAQLLCLSERTVEYHRHNLRKKLAIPTEASLGEYLMQLA